MEAGQPMVVEYDTAIGPPEPLVATPIIVFLPANGRENPLA
jgi:hypothetical protein